MEIQQQTLSSLLLLPFSRNSLCAQMAVGLLPAIAASLSCIFCGIILWFGTDAEALRVTGDVVTSAWFYEVFLILITTMYFGLFLSVRLRHAGMLLAIVLLWFLGPFVVASILGILSLVVRPQTINDSLITAVPLALIAVQVPVCVWLHKLLIRSLDRAGTQ